MNRRLAMAPGSDFTADLAVIRVLQAEANTPTIVIDASHNTYDLTQIPVGATYPDGTPVSTPQNPTGTTLQSLLATDTINGVTSASNVIYRPNISATLRRFPCLIVQDAVVIPTAIPNIQNQMVSVYAFDTEEAGVESITRIAYIVRALIHNNDIYSNGLGFLCGTLLGETATKNVVDYGWGKQLTFKFATSLFGGNA